MAAAIFTFIIFIIENIYEHAFKLDILNFESALKYLPFVTRDREDLDYHFGIVRVAGVCWGWVLGSPATLGCWAGLGTTNVVLAGAGNLARDCGDGIRQQFANCLIALNHPFQCHMNT